MAHNSSVKYWHDCNNIEYIYNIIILIFNVSLLLFLQNVLTKYLMNIITCNNNIYIEHNIKTVMPVEIVKLPPRHFHVIGNIKHNQLNIKCQKPALI